MRRFCWHRKVTRAFDGVCVFDVTSTAALTSMGLPKQVLEANTEYIWQARFIDSRDTASDWSEESEFTTAGVQNDLNENGVPDDQEISEYQDIDLDGTADIAQTDLRCVNVVEKSGSVQICVSIRNAANAYAIASLEAEDAADPQLVAGSPGKPNFIEFGLLDFKVLVDQPGDETTVTIYLSKPSFKKGNCFKYDPVNEVWLDYSGYTEFSANRKEVYLTIQDGGFGDADGLANGIIVDPLAFGSETDPNGGSGSSLDQLLDGVIPGDLSCFISAAAGSQPTTGSASIGAPVQKKTHAVILLLPALLVLVRFRLRRRKAAGSQEDSGNARSDPRPLL
jgi:chitinase